VRVAAALVVITAVLSTASVAPSMADRDASEERAGARVVSPRIQTLHPTDREAGGSATQAAPAKQRVVTAKRRTDPFSVVGVTWAQTSDPGEYDVAVRTRTDGRWTRWIALEVTDDGPDDVRGTRAGTAPYWVGTSDGVQARVIVPTGRRPKDIEVALVDPGRSAADGEDYDDEPTLQHEAPRPRIRTRKDWGADESLRTDEPRYTSTIKAGFVHHTAGSNDYTEEQVPQIIRGIYAYHVKSRGWSDIGYQFLVDRFGRLWEGRAGGVDRPVLGAHAGGFNTNTFGVSALGMFTETPAPEPMQEAIADLLAWKLALYHHDAHEKTVLVSGGGGTSRYPRGERVTVDRISGHRDVGRTACPGELLYEKLPRIRDMVAERMDEEAP